MTSKWKKSSIIEESNYYWNKQPQIFSPIDELSINKPKIVELFCGLGGLSLGFEMAGFSTVLGTDIFIPAIATFRKSHTNSYSILSDVKKLKSSIFLDLLGNERIDVVAAGIPCQGFSLNNRKRWNNDKRNFLFIEYIRIVQLLKPRFCLIENVPGLKTTDNGSFKNAIIENLEKIGNYKVDFFTLNASNFGVPQYRERIFFLAYPKDLSVNWLKLINCHSSKESINVRDAIGDLPKIEAGELASKYSSKPISSYQELMRGDEVRLTNHIAPKHPLSTIERIASTIPGDPMYDHFRQRIRLSWDNLSPTQVSGGIRPQFQFGHPEQNRGLTVRERCRIQSIPDNIEIFGGVVQGRVQTGNAVPPLLSKGIAKAILDAI